MLPDFNFCLTPHQMLALGVFEGKYLNKALADGEYPASWRKGARLSDRPDPRINLFRVKSRMDLCDWRANGWIDPQDPHGWFQWFCRYYTGRRTDDDDRQVKRHRAFVRHSGQVRADGRQDVLRRAKQRQALLQWSHDPFPDFDDLPGEGTFGKINRIMAGQRQTKAL